MAEHPDPTVVTEFTRYVGIHTTSPAPGRSEAVVELEPHHLNRAGTIHGGFLMTMMDTLMGRAVTTYVDGSRPGGRPPWYATSRLTTHFLEAASQGTLHGNGRVLARNGTFIVAEAEIRDDGGTLLATAQGQFTKVRNDK